MAVAIKEVYGAGLAAFPAREVEALIPSTTPLDHQTDRRVPG